MTVPYSSRLGFTARAVTSDADLLILVFVEPDSERLLVSLKMKMTRFTVFKTAAPTALLASVPLQDRWSRTRTGPPSVTCLAPRDAATLAFLSPQHPAASSQAERNNPDPSIFQGQTSRRQNVRSIQAGECERLHNRYPASVRNRKCPHHSVRLRRSSGSW